MRTEATCYVERWGDPTKWDGDWRRSGNYLTKKQQAMASARLETHRRMLVGMAIRGATSRGIAAVFSVSRESVDRRLRPLGLKGQPGQVGRPVRKRMAA